MATRIMIYHNPDFALNTRWLEYTPMLTKVSGFNHISASHMEVINTYVLYNSEGNNNPQDQSY